MNNTKKNHMLHIRSFIKNNNMYILFLVLLIACTLLSPDFLTLNNIINLGRQQSGLLIISMGLLFVIMTSGIDLASGAVMALTSVLMTFCLTTHQMSMGSFRSHLSACRGTNWLLLRHHGIVHQNGSVHRDTCHADHCTRPCLCHLQR